MSRYRVISSQLWADGKFRSLSPLQPSGQAMWLYLLTRPRNHNIPGVVVATAEMLAAELGWPLRSLREAFAESFQKGMARVDSGAPNVPLIWLPRAPYHDPPQSPNVVRSWARYWPEVPECSLKNEIFGELKAFVKPYASLREAFDKAFERLLKDFSTPDPDPDPYPREREARSSGDPEPDAGAAQQTFQAVPAKAKKAQNGHPELAQARQLWALQERLRAEVVPGARPLKATVERLGRVLARLKGSTAEDCEAVLRQLASEARANPEAAQWFNGETNWRPSNFDRTLGRLSSRNGNGHGNGHANGVDMGEDVGWHELMNLAFEEAARVRDGREIPWLADERRWSMREDGIGYELRPVGPPGVYTDGLEGVVPPRRAPSPWRP